MAEKNAHEVKITQEPEEAALLAAQGIPHIVWLNEKNKDAHFPNGAYCVGQVSDAGPEYMERVYRRFKGLPWDIAETSRIRIREITVEDVPALYGLYGDRDVTRYIEPLFPEQEQEIEYTKEYIKNIYGFYGYGMWILEEKQSGSVIGRAGLEYKEGFAGLELGFMLGTPYQHKGFAYEACSAVLEYGINKLGQKDYCAFVKEENVPSVRLCERLGFKKGSSAELNEMDINGHMVKKEFTQYNYHV